METFRSRSMNLNSGYANYQTSVRAMWRLAIYKAGMASRVVTGLLQSEQGQLSKQVLTNHPFRADKTTRFLAKTYQPKMKKAFNGLAYNITGAQENIVDTESTNQIGHQENMADMSSAQVVFAVIQKQQIEWDEGYRKG